MIVTGDPCSGERTPQHWFNTSAFSQTPANTYVLRTNPMQFGCLTGPKFFNLDGTLSKAFKINDRFSTEFKIHVLFFFNREIILDARNQDFEKTHVTSRIVGEAAPVDAWPE